MKDIDIHKITELQKKLTIRWHEETPCIQSNHEFLALIEGNHMKNFNLWHKEDEARRDDMGSDYVYHAKRSIDKFNQERNNFMEKIDRYVVEQLPQSPENATLHTETPGMIIDRLSILALKEYHMREEAERTDAPEEQRNQCAFKLQVIQQQLQDLKHGLEIFINQVLNGERYFKVYYQFKMYNDPNLNPQLYKKQTSPAS